MMLKIKAEDGSWWLYDNLTRVKFGHMEPKYASEIPSSDVDEPAAKIVFHSEETSQRGVSSYRVVEERSGDLLISFKSRYYVGGGSRTSSWDPHALEPWDYEYHLLFDLEVHHLELPDETVIEALQEWFSSKPLPTNRVEMDEYQARQKLDLLLDGVGAALERLYVKAKRIEVPYNAKLIVTSEPLRDYHRVTAVDANNDENLYLFDTEAYVLNDEGKTIEIIR